MCCTSCDRWVGRDWLPFGCYLLQYDSALMRQCAATAPLRLMLYGDSIMRGLYFDLVEALT